MTSAGENQVVSGAVMASASLIRCDATLALKIVQMTGLLA
jgi:hypothetical protein